MDGLILLAEAQAAGLTVLADGGKLVIQGPRSAEVLARRLIDHKTAVMKALKHPSSWEDAIDPPLACPKCNGLELWQNPLGVWRCMNCDPPTAALRLLERVEKARERKPTSQNQSGCTPAVSVDKTIVKANCPTARVVERLEGH